MRVPTSHVPRSQRCSGECLYAWCHHCGAVMPADEWATPLVTVHDELGPLELNGCPRCEDVYPEGMCLCDVLGNVVACERALAQGGDPRVPA